MSEPQKVFASVSGALVVHLVLLVFLLLLLSTPTLDSATPDIPVEPVAPEAVTVRMGDLMERVEVEPEEKRTRRPFIDTDLAEPEPEAPEDARFESDRNTSAASERQPDPSRPQEEGLPTLDGDAPLPGLQLREREFVDGRLEEPPAAARARAGKNSPSSSPAAAVDRSGSSSPFAAGTPPPGEQRSERDASASDADAEAEEEEGEEGAEEDEPAETVGDRRQRPDGTRPGASAEKETSRPSFTDPNADADAPASPRRKDEADRRAAPAESETETGPPMDEPRERHAAAPSSSSGGADADGKPADGTPQTKPPRPDADADLFAEGFSPEEHRNRVNGTLSNVGRDGVDAEATEVGRYKKKVKAVLARQWHRYRHDTDFVAPGVLRLRCRIAPEGDVRDLQVVENESNTMLAEFSLRAFQDAKIPPMPAEVRAELGIGGLELDYDIIIY